MHGGATPYVHDPYGQFQYTGTLPTPPEKPTPHHYLPFPPTSATAPHPGAQYDPQRPLLGSRQYSAFEPYVLQRPQAAEHGAALRAKNSSHKVVPKLRGPDVSFSQVAINMIAQKMDAPVGGGSNTYKWTNPIPVQQHSSLAGSPQKSKKTHHKAKHDTDDPVTAEDRANMELTPEEWRWYLEHSHTSPLQTVAKYKTIWKKILAKRKQDELHALQKAQVEKHGGSQPREETIEELDKRYKDLRQAKELEEVLARAGTQRSRTAVDRFGKFQK
jgi:hypothetical protein